MNEIVCGTMDSAVIVCLLLLEERCTHSISYINNVAIIITGMKHYIATDLSILYTSCWIIRSNLNRSMWICLGKIMILWGSLPAQPVEYHIIFAYTEQLCLPPGHQIIVAAKYDRLLSPEVENKSICPHRLMQYIWNAYRNQIGILTVLHKILLLEF